MDGPVFTYQVKRGSCGERRGHFKSVQRFTYSPFRDEKFIAFIKLKNYSLFPIIKEIHPGIWNNLMYFIKRHCQEKNVEKIRYLGKHQVIFSSHIKGRNKNLHRLEYK